MSKNSNSNSHDDVDKLYQQQKAQHKMPDALKASLQNAMAQKLKAEHLNVEAHKTKRSILLRHPAFALTFSLVLIVGVMMNDWISVRHQLDAQLDMPSHNINVGDIGKRSLPLNKHQENQIKNSDNLGDELQKYPSVSTSYAVPATAVENFSYHKGQAAQTNQQQIELALALAAKERQAQKHQREQVDLETTSFKAEQQFVDSNHNTNSLSISPELSTSQALSDQGASSQKASKLKTAAKQKTQASKLKTAAKRKALTSMAPKLRLLTVKAINNKQLQLLGCQGQTHTLSLGALPNTKVGNKLVIKTVEGETLPESLDERPFDIIPVAMQTQCE